MAQVAGAVIISMLIAKTAPAIGGKLGFSEEQSNMLGMIGGAIAGGYVAGAGSTAASQATAGGTSSQVGANIPAGYGGAATATGQQAAATYAGGASGEFAGVSAPSAGARTAAAGTNISAGSSVSRSYPDIPTHMAQPQASVQNRGMLQAPEVVNKGDLVDVPGSQASRGDKAVTTAEEKGMLSQAEQASAPRDLSPTGVEATAKSDTAEMIKSQQGLVDRTPGGSDEGTNWWERLFSPEKTMDLAMAAMGGYGDARMAKEDREYPYKKGEQYADEWADVYGGELQSLNQRYPGGYRGP